MALQDSRMDRIGIGFLDGRYDHEHRPYGMSTHHAKITLF